MLTADSFVWRYLGDRRYELVLPRAVSLQMLHPGVGAATLAHSQTPTRLWLHKSASVPQLVNMAYSTRDLSTVIRAGHRHVKGVDDHGERYHALNPELFFFVHATYVDSLVTMVNRFIRPLSARFGDQAAIRRFAVRRKARVALQPSRRLTADVRRTIATDGQTYADGAAGLSSSA